MILRILIIFLFTLFSANVASNSLAKLSVEESLSRAQFFLEQGQYYLALDEVNTILNSKPSAATKSRALGMKGSLLLLMQLHDEAEQFLLKAIESSNVDNLKAGYANSLGVLYHEKDKSTQSKEYFDKALGLARNNQSLALKIKLNQARSQPQSIEISFFESLFAEIANIDSATERTQYYINLAKTAKSYDTPHYQLAQKSLEKARHDAPIINDKLLQLELLASLSGIYEEQKQYQLALELTEETSHLTEQINADDLLLQIEWRRGRIYQRIGDDDLALAALGKAVDHLQTIRSDIPVKFTKEGNSSFRETMGPLYLDYVRLLLKKSEAQKGDARQQTLKLARKTIEQIKQTELEDYLGSRCMFQGMEYFELEKMEDKEVAVLYPIMLPDSVELLVEINQEIEHRRSVVRYEVIKKTALALSNILRTPPPTEDKKKSEREKRERTYKIDSKNLYQWLIGPIEQDLKNKKIKTLVIVPDGILRLVPFAALFDEKGKEFLVQKDYALSISPGLGLLGYSKNVGTSRNYRMLFAGLETPSEEYKKRYSEKKRQIKLEDYARFYFINPGGVEDQIKNEIKKELESLNLKHVKTELEELNNINGLTINKLLFNETFTKENLQREIQKNHYEIVHIASHGDFTSETGHLLTYNDELELSTLRKFLIRDKDTQESIQLLTFSACKTAIGDDRIPLGFTGAALQAEALSALGALWKISDETTARLMKCFYQHLTQHGGKAESLKQAQLELLKDPVNQDPFYWSPFILVGNWL